MPVVSLAIRPSYALLKRPITCSRIVEIELRSLLRLCSPCVDHAMRANRTRRAAIEFARPLVRTAGLWNEGPRIGENGNCIRNRMRWAIPQPDSAVAKSTTTVTRYMISPTH